MNMPLCGDFSCNIDGGIGGVNCCPFLFDTGCFGRVVILGYFNSFDTGQKYYRLLCCSRAFSSDVYI